MDLTGNYQYMMDISRMMQEVVLVIVVGTLFAYQCYPYLSGNKMKALIAGAAYSAMLACFYFLPGQEDRPNGVALVIRVCVGFMVLYLLEKKYALHKFFLSLTFSTLIYTVLRMDGEQGGKLSGFLYSQLFVQSSVQTIMWAYYFDLIEYVLFFAILTSLWIYLFHRACGFSAGELTGRDMLLLSIPPVMQFIQSFLYLDYYRLYADYFTLLAENGNDEKLQSLDWSNWYRFFDGLLFLAFWIAFLWLFFDLIRASREKMLDAVMQEQMQQLSKRVAQAEELYGQISGLRHDMSHHTSVIAGLLDKGDQKEAREYLSHMENELEASKPGIITGHPVTDIVMAEMEKEAAQKGLKLESEFYFSKDSSLDAFDISVILGNALSNAIDACDAGGRISVASFNKPNAYLIEIKNSYAQELSLDNETGLPKSKKKGPGHGIGLSNIQRIAEKYEGDILMEKQGDEVVLSVLLQTKDDC